MKRVFIHGWGAVSPAGWAVEGLFQAVQAGHPIPLSRLPGPAAAQDLPVRAVPPPNRRPDFLAHPRMRRTSPITHYALAAALQAVGPDLASIQNGQRRLGIVFCTMSGSVNYSRRFYDELLRDPAMASPLIFPETVFNAPASHLAAFFSGTTLDYPLVGDPATYLQGLVLAAHWLDQGIAESCLVVGAEEKDWLTSNALRLFSRRFVASEGAGALYLKSEAPASRPVPIALASVTDLFLFQDCASRTQACQQMREQLPQGTSRDLLCDGRQNIRRLDEPEERTWAGWPGHRFSPKQLFGEGLTAASAWQCVAAAEWLSLEPNQSALISITGFTQSMIGAHFSKSNSLNNS